MIKLLNIENLFGRFNYTIEIKDGGVTIITGPNGFGKSTILKIIEATAKCDLLYFSHLDFSKIRILLYTNFEIIIKKENDKIYLDDLEISTSATQNGEIGIEYKNPLPWLHRYRPNVWIDERTDKEIPENDLAIYCLYSEIKGETTRNFDKEYIDKLKTKIQQIQAQCGNVRLISEQRLIRKEVRDRRYYRDIEQIIDVVTELPDRLKTEISKVTEAYSAIANKLDSSYPRRLFSAREGLSGEDEYKQCLEDANQKFKKLNQYNLVEMDIIGEEQDYNNQFSTALKIYFEDFSTKYKVFESLIAKLDLFTEIINARLTFKKIEVSREHGFEVIDTDSPNKILQLSQLSSGEKQEIVLFYDLIFNIKSNLLLLIDEPEISLHVAWQMNFLDDLLKIAQISTIQVIVATHSPQILSHHWDIQVDLGELYGKY